ncbi:hypothetical protein Desaci_4527 [Desulfosporosinus acidiphilus SJ4]|uniref:Uncharacterized protein n=1 Tax=Desulfosporosinus acidiphilus (strain DSM 22704 / JCM 16185 / SJ4) TaxID=646529 RepID=I4DC43_DESAJ|nr:hypothetical protein [Desulfosporosinus acidiphilus]AFM43367.1 hypothetical protein Desaci_4527 [Desulfosporosinus acidiphilus SJ4]
MTNINKKTAAPLGKTIKAGTFIPETKAIAKKIGDILEHKIFNDPTSD